MNIDYARKMKQIKRPLDRLVLQALMESPLTRGQLMAVTGHDDRVNRLAIERLRNAGIVIVSSSKKAGYRLARDEKDVRAFVDDMQARARKANRTASKVKQAYGLKNQQSMELAG